MWVSHQRGFAGCCVPSNCIVSRSFKIWEAALDLLANFIIAAKKVIFLFISWKVKFMTPWGLWELRSFLSTMCCDLSKALLKLDGPKLCHYTQQCPDRSSEGICVGQVLVFKPEECRTECTCGGHTGLLVFPSSQLVVFLPLNLRFRKLRLEWRGYCCALTKPEFCTLLSSLQRLEFFIVACYNLLWSLSVFSSIHHP